MPPPGDGRPEPGEWRHDPTGMLPVEEEVDLTQLLEELKQWDPVLPEPRVRQREEPSADVMPVDTAEDAAVIDRVEVAQAAAPAPQAEGPTLNQYPPDIVSGR